MGYAANGCRGAWRRSILPTMEVTRNAATGGSITYLGLTTVVPWSQGVFSGVGCFKRIYDHFSLTNLLGEGAIFPYTDEANL